MNIAQFDIVVTEYVNSMGGNITLIRQIDGEYNTETSTFDKTETTYILKGLVFDYTLQSNGSTVKSGTMIEAGDKQLLVQPQIKSNPNSGGWLMNIDPATDRIVLNGDTWRIITTKDINPSGSDSCLWELYIRK